MTVSVTAEGDIELSQSLRDELVQMILDDIVRSEASPGPFKDADPPDVKLETMYGGEDRIYYTVEYSGDSDV